MTSPPSDRPVALVTGANRGLGLETSKQLLDDDYRVILTARDEKAGLAAAKKFDPTGQNVLFHQLDLLDSKSIAALAKDFSGLAPRLDVLVNNAGIGSWGADRRASIWPSAYSVSKVALNALTKILARDLAPRRIRVNSVCPGWVRTDMGGRGATRSVPVGARSIVLGVMLPDNATGGFYRDGKPIAW
jgi:NAD(P)-dependent dehydrogenase (short-subunit alcohol dehydrogenase family)